MTPEQPDLAKALQELAAEQKKLVRVLKEKPSGKDSWDKIASISVALSSVVVAGVAAFFTHEYDKAQVRINDVTVLEKFIPHLASRDPSEQKLAILGLSALGDTTIAVGIAKLYPTDGTFAGLTSIATNGSPGEQALAKDALKDALAACPASGSGGDPILNAQKNRSNAPSSSDFATNVRTPGDMAKLPVPRGISGMRSSWPQSAARQVNELEANAVTIEGYLVRTVRENVGVGESANCHEPKTLFDYHLYVSDQLGAGTNRAVVTVMTPRWREIHPSWGTPENGYGGFNVIRGLMNQHVRVTGWLLFNEEHLDQVGKYRASAWEIRPITEFQYQKNNLWTTL